MRGGLVWLASATLLASTAQNTPSTTESLLDGLAAERGLGVAPSVVMVQTQSVAVTRVCTVSRSALPG